MYRPGRTLKSQDLRRQSFAISQEIIISLPNNQRQHCALHIQKDVLSCALC